MIGDFLCNLLMPQFHFCQGYFIILPVSLANVNDDDDNQN